MRDGALAHLRDDLNLRRDHLANLPPSVRSKGGRIDAALATARAKIDLCEGFADVAGWLDVAETRALLGDRDLLARVLNLA